MVPFACKRTLIGGLQLNHVWQPYPMRITPDDVRVSRVGTLPSDSDSRWTPLLSANGLVGSDLPP